MHIKKQIHHMHFKLFVNANTSVSRTRLQPLSLGVASWGGRVQHASGSDRPTNGGFHRVRKGITVPGSDSQYVEMIHYLAVNQNSDQSCYTKLEGLF